MDKHQHGQHQSSQHQCNQHHRPCRRCMRRAAHKAAGTRSYFSVCIPSRDNCGSAFLCRGCRPPPVPVQPPLPLRALPIAVYLVGAWSCIGQVSSCMPLVPSCAQYSIHAAVSTFLDTARYISIHGQSEFPPQRLLLCVCIDTGSNRAAQTCTEFLQQRNSWFVQQFNGVGGGGYIRHTRRRRCERQGQTDRRPHV